MPRSVLAFERSKGGGDAEDRIRGSNGAQITPEM
jgi:hypothetical protein